MIKMFKYCNQIERSYPIIILKVRFVARHPNRELLSVYKTLNITVSFVTYSWIQIGDNMLWKPALFKGKKVWAQVNEVDELAMANGLVGIRYSTKEGATIYRASAKNIQLSSEPSKPLDKGETAPKLDDTKPQMRKKFGILTHTNE